MRAVQISRVSPEGADPAFRLVEEYFESIGVVAREDRSEFMREYFGRKRGIWLARAEDEWAGCIALRVLRPVNEHARAKCAEIKRLYVREKFRGRGIAQKLLEAAERFARKASYQWTYLDTTDQMAAAARLYERNGYKRCERYNANPQATIFMRKNLGSDP